MSETLGQCQHESCIKTFNSTSMRTYACAHHCTKMLCMKHLNEHEQLIDDQTESKRQLKQAWDDYSKTVGVHNLEKQYQDLEQKIEFYHELRERTEDLLSLKTSDSSMENNKDIQIVTEIVLNRTSLENRSTSITDGNSTVTTNNGGETPPAMIVDPIHTTPDSPSIETQNLIISMDQEDDEVKILESKTMPDGDILLDLLDHNEGTDRKPAVSETTSAYCTIHVANDLADVCFENINTSTRPPLDEFKEILNDSGPKQAALEKSDSDSSLDDVSYKNRSAAPEFKRQLSEESCY
ncbi:unnamed protein product [Rotaria magnacalcarata]|uniref:Uncharacterized protein n=1 Tax=Rotaria magnacalcarata TaxID=392030 RepID=A0A816SLG2_9BILA|nr:unnamed protein product [Rotaria magnacalcarata]CAF2109882.1 unnamed protein product [Rotaria magnacalcarata]